MAVLAVILHRSMHRLNQQSFCGSAVRIMTAGARYIIKLNLEMLGGQFSILEIMTRAAENRHGTLRQQERLI